MSVSGAYQLRLPAVETLGDVDLGTDNTVTHNGWDTAATLNAGSTPPFTTVCQFTKALASGAATIDLTGVPTTNGATANLTGLKVQMARFQNPSANNITVSFGAANSYNLLGAAFVIVVHPGAEVICRMVDTAPDVASGAKNIDLSGTLAQTLRVTLWAG